VADDQGLITPPSSGRPCQGDFTVRLPNDASIIRLVEAMMLEQNDERSLNRRYMQLEGLQTLSETAATRLPAVAR
jgi:hypothetical protein